jgi:serine/threonine protein kinase
MLDHTNTVRILHFGLARVLLPDPWGLDEGDGAASRAVLGTIPYMSPEQTTDSTRADARSDIYSLGCTLHFLLTGRPPYSGRTWSEMYLAHRQAPIPSLKAVRPSVPDYLEDLFRQMLAKDPGDRPRTMAEVNAKIELALGELRAKSPSSQTIPVRPDEPDESAVKSTVNLESLEIEGRAKSRRKEIYYTGRRLKPPDGPLNFTLLARYLLLTGALIVALIILIELFLRNARGVEPLPADTEDRASVSLRSPSSRSPIPGPPCWRKNTSKTSRRLTTRSWGWRPATRLVRAFALDVLEARAPESEVTAEEAERWVRSAACAKVEQFSTPGLGQDIRLEAAGLAGAALIVEDQPVHVELFVD